jgi:hypothetical protein
MRGRKPEYQPTFSSEQVRQAAATVGKHGSPQNQVRRARLALELAKNPKETCPEMGLRLGLHPQTVRKWRKRWATEGFSLEDKPRSGRPKYFSPSAGGAGQGHRL